MTAATAPAVAHAAAQDAARVLVCDDSATIRGALTRILEADPAIRVTAHAADGQAALDALKRHEIDVIVLDIEMPGMDGLTALPLLLRARPGVAVVMASSLTARGADITMRALRLGAADYVPKPSALRLAEDARFGPELIAKVTGLARLRRHRRRDTPPLPPLRPAPPQPPRLLAIGSSTGGPHALFTLLRALPPKLGVPVIITQHMPPAFTPRLAEHLNALDVLPCRQATEGAPLIPGEILLAPGDFHLIVRRAGATLTAHLSQSAPENFCRPAVDPMLRAAADATDGRTLAVILTGMGADGLDGTRHLVAQGGTAIVQDEASSVVWGMPGAVARAGLAHAVLPIGQIGAKIVNMLEARA